jgi:hypothetical protein
MKKFLLFGGYNYYPLGGWSDFLSSSDTIEEVQKKLNNFSGDWWHIVDTSTGKIVKSNGGLG